MADGKPGRHRKRETAEDSEVLELSGGYEGEPKVLPRSPSPADVGAAIAAGALLATTTNPAAIFIGTTLPVVAQLVYRLDEKAWIRRFNRGAEVLSRTARRLEVSVEEVAELGSSTDAKSELMTRVLEAAAFNISLESKIEGLSRVLAMGLSDDSRIDDAALLATTIGQLEAVHVRVLNYLNTAGRWSKSSSEKYDEGDPRHTENGWVSEDSLIYKIDPDYKQRSLMYMVNRIPDYQGRPHADPDEPHPGVGIGPYATLLVRLGLAQHARLKDEDRLGGSDRLSDYYKATQFADTVLELLREPAAQPKAADVEPDDDVVELHDLDDDG